MPTIKQLTKVLSVDGALNRVQDQLASALNPILRNVQGDLTGPLEAPTVRGLQGTPVSSAAPATGQYLAYNGTAWAPAAGAGAGVTAVTASSPLSSSGGTTPNISLTGVVAAANGGTGLSASGTLGNVLTSDGSGGWVSSAPAGGAPSGPAGGVLGFPGSTYPNPNGLAPTTFAVTKNIIDIAAPYNGWPITFKPQDGVPAGGLFVLGQSLEVQGSNGAFYNGTGGAARLLGGDGGTGGAGTFGGDGGPVEMIGGTGSIGGAGASVGGAALVSGGVGLPLYMGGKGGDTTIRGGNSSLTGGGVPVGLPGDVYIRGGRGTPADGTVYIGDINTSEVRVAATSVVTFVRGPLRLETPALQTITAATDFFTVTKSYLQFEVTGGNVTLTSTPTIVTTGVAAGTMVLLHNVGAANRIRLTRGAAEALSLSAGNRDIDPGGSMTLVFDGTYWNEVTHQQATSI